MAGVADGVAASPVTTFALTMDPTADTGAEIDERTTELRQVAAARGGDREAFAEIVRRHQDRVFRLASRFHRRPQDVEDAAQETFLRVWEKLHGYRADAPLENWITRVCLNVCRDRLRRRRPDEDGEELPASGISDVRGVSETRLEAERLLERLPADDRFVLLMLHGEGWTVAEIADRLGWSKSNVKVRAFRARRRLRAAVEEDAASHDPEVGNDVAV